MLHRLTTIVLAVAVFGYMSHPPPAPVVQVVPPVSVVEHVPVAPPAMVVPVFIPTPAPQPAPPVSVADPDDLGPCPAPFRRGSDVAIAEAPEGIEIDHLAASPYDVRLLAAWNADVILLSTDEGRSWRRVLDGTGIGQDGDGDGIGAARFDCHGRLHVVRGDGMLGTHDDGAADPERWVRALRHDVEADVALVEDGTGVAVIAVDAADDQQLILARRDARGRWRSAPLFRDDSSGSWDGVMIGEIRELGRGRIRMMAIPWDGGDCSYSEYRELTFSLDLRRGVDVIYHEGEAAPAGWTEAPGLLGFESVTRDAAGRWVAVSHEPEADAMFVRMSNAAWRARVAAEQAELAQMNGGE